MNSCTYLIVSDIHGAAHGAEAAEEAFHLHHADWILCLGDILYHGPRNDLPEDYDPKKVITIMNRLKDRLICVRGNCEAEVDQMVLAFPCMADYQIIPYENRRVFMSHGHIYGPERLPILSENDIFLSGHTHIPAAEKKNGIWLINPGSMSLPKQSSTASYGLLKDGCFYLFSSDHRLLLQKELK